ncbi:S9 family peptidase [Thalassococcus sp. S3]|uniref:alpha/beta hydrolase family protein n=1 Tax=Thalassococcus sp. S3 TaxID=2017482 RepID=UPI0013EECB77|nr:alpha/beta fold hydrolase [Thalassococcus sp. S3]
MLKKIAIWALGLIAFAGMAGTGAYLWASRDIPPTHPTLAEADLPDLIPVRHFWASTAEEWAYKPSFDGQYIAYRAVRWAQGVVILSDIATRKEMAVLEDVSDYYWSDIEAKLYAIIEGRLWLIDPYAPDRDNWSDVTPRGFSGWTIKNRVRGADDLWLISSRDRNPAFADIYTTRQDGGGKRLLLENEGRTLDWVFDAAGNPVLRFDRREDEYVDLFVLDDPDTADWRLLMTISPTDHFRVHDLIPERNAAIVMSSRDLDKVAFVEVDLETGDQTVIYGMPDTDLLSVVNLDPHDSTLDLIYNHGPGRSFITVSKRGSELAYQMDQLGERVFPDDFYWAGTGRFVTATLSPNAKSYEYLLFDLENGNQTHLGTFHFRDRHQDKLALTEEVTITARDGLELPALLVRPKGVEGPVPLLVEVHGGPAQHVAWSYAHFWQFFANRGYAVLSVNFRGSTGYGKRFQAAGFREFGRAMQQDLYDAAAWAVDQGIADPEAMAIAGGSYGGYAAAMAATDPASPFAAAIVAHAVLDVEYQMRNNPFAWGLSTINMERYFGSLDNEEDLENMRRYSPLNRIEDLSIPVLMVAGKRDRVVGFEQTEEFIRQAEAQGKSVEELIFENEGHGVSRWQSSVRHARVIEEFLAEHLGGRSGGWDISETLADYID